MAVCCAEQAEEGAPAAEIAQSASLHSHSADQQASASSAAAANANQSAAAAQQTPASTASQPSRQPHSKHATADQQPKGHQPAQAAATAAGDLVKAPSKDEQKSRVGSRGQLPDRSRAADRKPRQSWSSVRRTKASQTGSPLVDRYSSVISDSEDSDAEEPQRPASLLGNVNASDIQCSEIQLLVIDLSAFALDNDLYSQSSVKALADKFTCQPGCAKVHQIIQSCFLGLLTRCCIAHHLWQADFWGFVKAQTFMTGCF